VPAPHGRPCCRPRRCARHRRAGAASVADDRAAASAPGA
jgi:hypothetical protein